MNFIEYSSASLPCGTVIYSYARTSHGYVIKLCDDSGRYCITSNINIPRDTLLTVMEHLIQNGITPDTMQSFIGLELSSLPKSSVKSDNNTHSNYLYL